MTELREVKREVEELRKVINKLDSRVIQLQFIVISSLLLILAVLLAKSAFPSIDSPVETNSILKQTSPSLNDIKTDVTTPATEKPINEEKTLDLSDEEEGEDYSLPKNAPKTTTPPAVPVRRDPFDLRLFSQVADVAGHFVEGYADGDVHGARFDRPEFLAFDARGTLYISDSLNSVIRKLSPFTNSIEMVVGSALQSGHADGYAPRFDHPAGIVFDSQGNLLVADLANHCIRRVKFTTTSSEDSEQVIRTLVKVETVAGFPMKKGYADGIKEEALFAGPVGLAIDKQDNLFVADSENCVIRKVTPDGNVTTVAGYGEEEGDKDSTLLKSLFNKPWGLAIHYRAATNNSEPGAEEEVFDIYVTDSGNHKVKKINLQEGKVQTVAGAGSEESGYVDGVPLESKFFYPRGILISREGKLYVADWANEAIREIDLENQKVSTWIDSKYRGKLHATLNYPSALVQSNIGGVVYISDEHSLKMVS